MTPNVAVGYLHPGEVSTAFHHSILHLFMHEQARTGFPPYVFAQRCGTGGLVDGRNGVCRDFLDRTRAEWLLFIDADMGFPADSLERLIASAHFKDRPIMGGLCFGLRRESTDFTTHAEKFRTFPTIYQWRDFGDRAGFEIIPDYPRGEVVLVSATGAAFLLIHRSALLAMKAKHGPDWFSIVTHPTGTTFSEDMSFCIRAQACDLPIHVDTSVKTCHDKGGVFLDEDAFDRQQALDAPVPVAV